MPCAYVIKYGEHGRVWHQFNGNMSLGVLHLPNGSRFKGMDWVVTPRLPSNVTTLTEVTNVIRNRDWRTAFELRGIVALQGYLNINGDSIRQDDHLYCQNNWLQWVHVGDEFQIPNTDWIYATVQHLEIGLPVPGTDRVCYWKVIQSTREEEKSEYDIFNHNRKVQMGLIPQDTHSQYAHDNGTGRNGLQRDGEYDNSYEDYDIDSSRNSRHGNDDRASYNSGENGFGVTHDGWSHQNENNRDRQNGYQHYHEDTGRQWHNDERLRSDQHEDRNQGQTNWNDRYVERSEHNQYNNRRYNGENGSEGYGRKGDRPGTGVWETRRTQNEPDWENYHQDGPSSQYSNGGYYNNGFRRNDNFFVEDYHSNYHQEGSSNQYSNGRHYKNGPRRNDDFFDEDYNTNPHQEGTSASFDHFFHNGQRDYAGNQFSLDQDEHRYPVADYPPDDHYTQPTPPMRVDSDGRFNFDDLTDEFIEESRQRARALFSHEENAVSIPENQKREQHLDRELEESGQPESVQEPADQDIGMIQVNQQQVDVSESESSESESSDTELEEHESSTTPSPEPSQTISVGNEYNKVKDTNRNNAESSVEPMMQILEMRNFSSLIFFLFVSIFVAFLLKNFFE